MGDSLEIQQTRQSCWPEILKRLQPSQLGICLCVSKTWNTLISSSVFITSHLKHFSKKSNNLFLLRNFNAENHPKRSKELYHVCSDTKQTLKNLETLVEKTYICPFKTRNGCQFRFVGSVNGVVYLSDDCYGNTYNFILWNPLVNCFVHLPKPRARYDVIGPYMCASGFGYDDVSDDFKVVRIVYPRWHEGLDETPPRAELYSVNEGKWRWVYADNVEYCTTDMDWSQCFVNGNVHWVAYERYGAEKAWSHKSTLLLLFNVSSEKFLMMKLPVLLRDACPTGLIVSEFQGLLCVKQNVLTEMLLGELVEFNLWVKKEYNKVASWCKVVSVDLRSRLHQVFYRRENGELLILSKQNELLSYDVEKKKGVMLAPDRGIYDASSYVETLALLNKDCKNRRSFLPKDDEDGSSDDNEEITAAKLHFIGLGKMAAYMHQLTKYRRQF